MPKTDSLEPTAIGCGRVEARPYKKMPLPKHPNIRRYILTCAQSNTQVYSACWTNLLALARYLDATVLVSRFTYDKSSYGSKSVKPGSKRSSDYDGLWYAPDILDYVCDERIELAPGLVFCGELNILPTAENPLNGLEAYTGRHSAIIPHVKLAMVSITSGKFEATKFNYSTGTVTQRNYVQKKAGLKAEPWHSYGAILVEVDSDGCWFVRQLTAGPDGDIHDLDIHVKAGKVTPNTRVEAITWGDTHVAQLDPVVKEINWGPGGILDTLRPKFQFCHDVLDFYSRNHHERDNTAAMLLRYITQSDSVEAEIRKAAEHLRDIARPWCHTIVVDSNHDRSLEKWLTSNYNHLADPINLLYYLNLSTAYYEAISKGQELHLFEHAVKLTGLDLKRTKFLREDESFITLHRYNDGIENGMHGHLGPNGKRGHLRAFTKMCRRANIGHGHYAGIDHGIFQAATSSLLDLKYNRGPNNWSHSHILTYPNSTRAILTIWKGKYKA
jgi:hypothetical protein